MACGLVAALLTTTPGASASEQTYGGPAYDAVYDVIQTDDGGYIAVGNSASFDPTFTYYDVYLIKTDAAGNLQWERTFGTPGKESGYGFNSTSDGGYIIVGAKTDPTDFTSDVYVIKVDGSGNLQWEQTYGGAVNEKARAVQQTLDGGYVVFGDSNSFATVEFEQDMYVIKLDANGAKQWETVIGGDYTEWTWDGMQTADGGYVVVGDTRSYSAPVGWADVYLVKLDANGQQVWAQTYGDINIDTGRSVIQTADGGFMIAGESQPSGFTAYQAYLIKTDPTGVMQWSQTYGAPTLHTVARCIKATAGGGYIVAGDQNVPVGLDKDAYLLKVDALGVEQWEKTYGGPSIELMYAVTVTSDDGYVLAGRTMSYGAGNYDAYLIKLNSDGEHDDPWEDLGDGLAGTHGVPSLVGTGTLLPGDDVTLTLAGALENSTTNLVVGFSQLGAPFKGGTLVPNPDILLLGLPTGPSGSVPLVAAWPGGVPSGMSFSFQHWISDGAAPAGFAASNAVSGTAP
jgi:hypothetical protein